MCEQGERGMAGHLSPPSYCVCEFQRITLTCYCDCLFEGNDVAQSSSSSFDLPRKPLSPLTYRTTTTTATSSITEKSSGRQIRRPLRTEASVDR